MRRLIVFYEIKRCEGFGGDDVRGKKNGDLEAHLAAAAKVKLSASNESVAADTIP